MAKRTVNALMKTDRFFMVSFLMAGVMIFGGTAVYADQAKNTCGIHIINTDGTGVVRLTTGKEWQPRWSPDGKRFVYNLSGKIYGMNADGSGKVKLADSGTNPIWSPDGKQIVYSLIKYPATYEIHVVNADGTNHIRIVTDGAYPAWSPDGKRIAFTAGRRKRNGIFLINPDGTGESDLTYDNGTAPAWSPDGKRIAYHRSPSLGTNEIVVINADGTGSVKIVDSGSFPVWSPDGKRIAYSVSNGVGVVNVDGTEVSGLDKEAGYSYRSIFWSPDAKTIACYRYKLSGENEIYLINTDGSGKTLLIDYGRFPCWSPDGKRIAFAGTCK